MSAPQQKPKRDRKEGKKRQRAGSAAGAGSASPRAGAGDGAAANSFTIPKRKGKRSKGPKEEGGGLGSPRVKGEEQEATAFMEEVAPSRNSANRMVTAPQKANILPRVGLGLTDATNEMSAMRHADSGGGGRNGDRSPSKTMMSLAVAAASVAASEAAIAAAVAAASTSAPAPAPAPKALGLKKLLHQRVQHDEANSNPAFSPKKLLKHRLLAAQQPPPPPPTSSAGPPPPPSPSAGGEGGGNNSYGAGGGGYMDGAGSSRYPRYPGQVDGREPPLARGDGHFGGGDMGGRPGYRGGYTGDPSHGGGGAYGGGRVGGYNDERDRVAAEGELNGRVVGDGDREYSRRRDMGGGGPSIKEEIDDRGHRDRDRDRDNRHPGRGESGVPPPSEGNFRGGFDRGRSSVNGEQRREAEFSGGGGGGNGGYNNGGASGPPAANGMHPGGGSGGGWRDGSEERRGGGRFAKDVAANDKWQGGRGAERMDAPRPPGYDPSSYGPPRKRSQEVSGWKLQRGI